jgi:hypothetical protein
MYFDIQILGNVMPENLNVGDVKKSNTIFANRHLSRLAYY